MDEQTQEELREIAIKKWQQQAWEGFCQCDLLAGELVKLSLTRGQAFRMRGELQTEMEENAKLPDHHTVENRERRKSLKDSIDHIDDTLKQYDSQLENDTKMLIERRIESMRHMVVIEHARAYKYEAPPESDDAPPVDAISAEAAGQKPGIEICAQENCSRAGFHAADGDHDFIGDEPATPQA